MIVAPVRGAVPVFLEKIVDAKGFGRQIDISRKFI